MKHAFVGAVIVKAEKGKGWKMPPVSVCSSEESSWNTIWKWEWFSKGTMLRPSWREEEEDGVNALHSHLSRLDVKSILDCSCGLGFKTILLAELGYEVEGSDGSGNAVRYAAEVSKEEGVNIRFFQSRWEELGDKCKRKFDCVFSDAFDWIRTKESLEASAKGIYPVLNEGGLFVFGVPIAGSKNTKKELSKYAENVWRKQQRFEVFRPYEKDGQKLTVVSVYDKVKDGILENRIHLIEEKGMLQAEIALMLDLYKWTWTDYTKVLKKAGFRKVYGFEEKGIGHNATVK
jgi:SAM-dependent methyltransferase